MKFLLLCWCMWMGASQKKKMTINCMPAMKSASGRKMIFAAIRDWRAATMNKPDSYYYKRGNLRKLDVLAASVEADVFTVVNNRISSQFENQYPVID